MSTFLTFIDFLPKCVQTLEGDLLSPKRLQGNISDIVFPILKKFKGVNFIVFQPHCRLFKVPNSKDISNEGIIFDNL